MPAFIPKIGDNNVSVVGTLLGAVLKGSGTYVHSTGTVEFANSNGVTFGLDTNGSMTASVAAGGLSAINVSAGSTSNNLSALTLADSNGISFGLSGSVITGTVKTDYQTSGAYLTTAMQSNAGSNFVGLNTALTGNGVSATINSSGISLNVPAFLTTAQPVGAYLTTARGSTDAIGLNTAKSNVTWTVNSSGLSLDARGYAGTGFTGTNASATFNSNGLQLSVNAGGGGGGSLNISAGTTSNNLTALTLADSNGISFGLNGSVITGTVKTDYQSSGAYLTTAMASNRGSDFLGTNTALTANGVSMTANSSGLSLNFPAFLTTAAQSNHSHNVATTTTNGSLVVVATTNSAGATLAIPPFLTTAQSLGAYLTTAAQSNHSHNLATTTTNGSLIVVATTNSNGATLAVPPFLTTAQAPGAYLTTARASNDAIGLNTALTANGVSVTANSSGLSLNFPAFLTTAALSNHSHGNPTLALTNLSGTTASNSAGLTLSLSAAAPAAGVGIVAGTRTATTANNILFDTGNGVTFGLNAVGGSVMTASVNTSYRASNDAIGLNTALTAGPLAWTVGSAGISLNASSVAGTTTGFAGTNVSASITHNTAGLSINLSVAPPVGGGGSINFSAGTTSGSLSAVTFANSNGISFGLNAGTITATVATNYQSQGAYLTTAMASNKASDFVAATAAFAGTNASGTIASNGISISVNPAAAGVGIIAGTRTATTAGAILFDTGNGITFGLNAVGGSIMTASHNGLTTAMASNRGSDFMGTNTALTANGVSMTANSSGLSLNFPAFLTTAQPVGAYLTTARASNDAVGLNTALTGNGVAWTVNSSGISLNVPAFLTTAQPVGAYLTTAALSDHSHGNPTLALTNLSGTTASNSAGLTLSLSAGAGGAGDGYNIVSLGTTGTTGTAWSTATGTVAINGSGGVIVSQNNSNQLVISGPATSSIVNTGQLSLSVNGSTISLGVPESRNTQRLQWPPGNLTAVAAMGNGSFSINRMQQANPLSATRLDVPFLVNIGSSAAANTWGFQVTAFAAIYTKNGNTLSSLSSGSTAWSTSKASNNAGCTQLNGVGIRPMSVPMNINMTPGEYYVGFGISTNTSSAGTATTALGNTWSIMGGPIYSSAVPHVGDFTAATNTSTGLYGGHGVYSAAISTVPPTVSLSAINQTGSYYARANMGIIFRNL